MKIVITTAQVAAVAKIVADDNDANAHGYSVERTEAVKLVSTVAGLVLQQCNAEGDIIATKTVHSDGRVS